MPAKRRIEDDLLDIDIWDVGVQTESTGNLPEISDGLSKRDFKKIKENVYADSDDLSQEPIEEAPEEKPREEKIIREERVIREEPREEKPKPARKEEPVAKPMPEEDKTTYLYEDEHKAMLKDVSSGTHHAMSTFPFRIGRKDENDLVIENKTVSSLHAEVDHMGDKFFIKDVGSLNGTFVNGYKIPEGVDLEIKNGQEILFANKKYVFHVK